MALGWYSTSEINNRGWVCGYCGCKVGGNVGYKRNCGNEKFIYICPHCENPTAFIDGWIQIPEAPYGEAVPNLPEDIYDLYEEIRRCVQYSAYTAAVLALRKLLMHIAVEEGASEDLSFMAYVEYLSENGFIPPKGKAWVEEIRKRGNEASHKIVIMKESEAKQLMDFAELLLRFNYEFPARLT